MPCRASLGWSSKGRLSDSSCSSTTQLSGQEGGQGRLGGTIASLDGSQNISTSEVGLMSPHGSSCLPQLPEGDLATFSLFFSFETFNGACGSTNALRSLSYEWFLHQQQGVVIGMVTDFLYLITITNFSEALKKQNKDRTITILLIFLWQNSSLPCMKLIHNPWFLHTQQFPVDFTGICICIQVARSGC